MIRMVEINDSQFNNFVLKSSLPVLLECTSPECIICKTMADRIVEAGKEYLSKMVFMRLNINENKRWQDFNVRVIPTLLYFKNGVLVARQDSFPDPEEIHAQIQALISDGPSGGNVSGGFKAAIDLEHIAAKFYKHLSASIKNGRAKEKFRLIHQESMAHEDLLLAKFLELTGERYAPSAPVKIEGMDLKPQGFSAVGAMKMALNIEEKLLVYYKRLQKEKLVPDSLFFKKLAKEETGHRRVLLKEMKFLQDKDLFKAIESPDYPNWLNKVFE